MTANLQLTQLSELRSMNAPVMVEVGGATDPLEVFTAKTEVYALSCRNMGIKLIYQLHHPVALQPFLNPRAHVFECINRKVYNHKGTIPNTSQHCMPVLLCKQ